ncbi:MAG: membrane protein insertion efficiency factor YidD, partial [Acidiferrobacteraceae bacterium]|nr:membrane protein insertion efficiency factor YidD [Acidiferrobacteraceae bacterium]
CSQYTIKAIEKYGLLIGITNGTKRLLRCKPPYGGVDEP